jgi:hypothetical protein
MKKFAKDILAEIRKRVIELIVVALGMLFFALSPTVRTWGTQLSLSESQVSSIQYWLIFAGSLSLVSVAWLLFLRTFRKLRLLETKLASSESPAPGDLCPYCRKQTGNLLEVKEHPMPGLAVRGVTQGYYKCSSCGRKYDKQVQGFHG